MAEWEFIGWMEKRVKTALHRSHTSMRKGVEEYNGNKAPRSETNQGHNFSKGARSANTPTGAGAMSGSSGQKTRPAGASNDASHNPAREPR